MTDAALVGRALQGDAAAQGELVRQWSARIFAFCYVRCGSRHLAEDLAQETLLRGLRGLATLDAPERFGPWLRGIAQHVYLDWRKSKQASQVTLSTLGPDGSLDERLMSAPDDAVRQVDREDDLRELRRAVATLDEDVRETLLLYYAQNVTYAELAEMLGVSPATVNARLTKARAALRERLDPLEK